MPDAVIFTLYDGFVSVYCTHSVKLRCQWGWHVCRHKGIPRRSHLYCGSQTVECCQMLCTMRSENRAVTEITNNWNYGEIAEIKLYPKIKMLQDKQSIAATVYSYGPDKASLTDNGPLLFWLNFTHWSVHFHWIY